MEKTNKSFFLEIASEILENGRVKNQDDWEELKAELESLNMAADRKIEDMRYIKWMWSPREEEEIKKENDGASETERDVLRPIFCALLGQKRGKEFLQKKASLREFQGVAVQLINDLALAGERAAAAAKHTDEQPSLWARGEIQERARLKPSEWLADLEKIKARGEILYYRKECAGEEKNIKGS